MGSIPRAIIPKNHSSSAFSELESLSTIVLFFPRSSRRMATPRKALEQQRTSVLCDKELIFQTKNRRTKFGH